MMSARFTPAATTSTITSPGIATGSGTSIHCSTSGPPGSVTVIACMGPDGNRSPGRAPSGTLPGMTDPWPLRGLVLRTPRLELRPDDDEGLHELAALAAAGVHAEDEMPFLVPWTRFPNPARSVLQYQWRCRAVLAPESWTLNFVVRVEGTVVGMQELSARSFALLREVETGSYL